MNKRKIADCVNIRIRVGDFQHIEIVKYAEEEIEYDSNQDRKEKEDALTDSLVDSMMRSLEAIPKKLGKGKTEAIEVQQAITKAIPAWLASDPVPNIANVAKKIANTEIDKQQAEKEKAIAVDKSVIPDDDGKLIKDKKLNFIKKGDSVTELANDDVGDLFEPDSTIIAEKTVSTKAEKAEKAEKVEKVEKVEKAESDGFDLFSDSEDLFGDK